MLLEDYRGFDGTVVIVLNKAEFEEVKSDLDSYDRLIELNDTMKVLLKELMNI